MTVQVKVCGLCDAGGAKAAIEAGADLLGFHFCSSNRRVTPEEARAIVDGLSSRPTIVGVFIDEDPAAVRQIADFVGLDLLQLHGSEAPGFDAGRPVMKVLKVKDGAIPDAGAWPDPIMLDSWSADQRGGTGQTWDWERARELLATR
ncbi:MAG: phosphoribosylanthranilate isomerase, partial [Candidatus Dormiibacterota bacterium]